jgi:DNA repair protein RadC
MKALINSNGIRSWSETDRPREKMLLKGRKSLTNAELLAIIIGTGTREKSAVDVAKLILKHCEFNLNNLAQMEIRDLMKIPGIGEAKAISIVGAFELSRRRRVADIPEKPKISTSYDIFQLMTPFLLDLKLEEFYAVFLNRANEVLKIHHVSTGGLSGTVADPRVIFAEGMAISACSMVLVHNHPSGNTNPSQADIKLTNRLREGGKMLDMPVLDHIIFTNSGYFSFADKGFMKDE